MELGRVSIRKQKPTSMEQLTSRVGVVELDVGKDSSVLKRHNGFHDTSKGCSTLAVTEIGLALFFFAH